MVVQSRSQEGKSYRERQIAAIGRDEWNRRERERKRRSRAQFVSEEHVPTPSPSPRENDPFDNLVKKIFKAKTKLAQAAGKTITERTIRTQLTKVLATKRRMGITTPAADFNFLKDTERVLNFINNQPELKTENSRIAYISAIASVLITLQGFKKPYKIYSVLSTHRREAVTEESGNNKLTEKEKINYLTWDKLKGIYTKADNLRDKALLAITTLLPPRRVKAYQFLTVGDDVKKNLNYVKLDADGKPATLIYQLYKTAKTYGKQEIPIPANLSKILRAYIKHAGLQNGDPLFGSKKKYVANFSTMLSSVYKKYTGKAISSNILRHSYISDFLNKPRSTNQKKEIANRMGHGLAVQQSYLRL